MKRLKAATLLGLVLAFTVMPARADAQVILDTGGPITGGTGFATTLSGVLTWMGGGIVELNITTWGPGVFAAIGLVNVPAGSVSMGTAPTGWTWETTQQLSGDGLPETIWSWLAPTPRPMGGLQPGSPGESGIFTFDIGTLSYTNLGFAVHAISGPGDCSTKFGAWTDNMSGQVVTNDVGEGNYDSNCVSVPEPSSMALLATGLAGLAFIGRRRRTDVELEDGEDTEI